MESRDVCNDSLCSYADKRRQDGCFARSFSAFCSRLLPGSILNQVDARERKVSSSTPICSNQRNRVFPAVHAKGCPSFPSCGPGAWPTRYTFVSTALGVTTGPIMFGHLWQDFTSARCVSRVCCDIFL